MRPYTKERRCCGIRWYIISPNGWSIAIVDDEKQADVLLQHLNRA